MIPRYPITYFPVHGQPHFSTQNLDDAGKIFIGGIPADATKDTLADYFSQFGEVSDSIIMVDNITGRSRGFGFVTFLDPSSVDEVLSTTNKHSINGKIVDAKKAVPKGPNQSNILKAMGVTSNRADRNPDCKVFVGGVAQGTTETDLANYFKMFGKVLEVKIPKDQNTQRARGFSFVLFDNPESVENATKERYHSINNKSVEVKTVHLPLNNSQGLSDKSSDDGNFQSPPSPFMPASQRPGYYPQYTPSGYVGIRSHGQYYEQPYVASPSGSSCSIASMGSTGIGSLPPRLNSATAQRVDDFSPYMTPIYQGFSDLSISQQYQRRGYPAVQYSVHADQFSSQGSAGYSPTPVHQQAFSASPVPSSLASLGYQHPFGSSPPVYATLSAPSAPPHGGQPVPAQYPVAVSTPQPVLPTNIPSFKR